MKKSIFLFVCMLACFFGPFLDVKAQELDSETLTLRSASESLLDNPQDTTALNTLFLYAKNTNGIDRLRSRCMAGVALSALFKGNTNLYIRARNSHARNYPEDMHLLKIDLKDCLLACKTCRGKGIVTVRCPVCLGEGKGVCPVCKGRGTRMNKQALKGTRSVGKFKCEACDGTGRITCSRCEGHGEVNVTCKECNGKAYAFKISPQVQEDFALIVKGIVKWINNEEVFYKKYQEAKNLVDPNKRIAMLKKLIKVYSYRDEIVEMKNLLAADMNSLKETREKESIAAQEVRTLLKLKSSETPLSAAATIRDYLDTHPECKSKVELQTLAVQLVAKAKKKSRNRKIVYTLAGVFVFLFGLSCINITHYKYDIFSSRSKLPGEKE